MQHTFKDYLEKQKNDNKYSSNFSGGSTLNELFDNKKKTYYTVSIDFTSEYLVKTLSSALVNEYRTKNPDETTVIDAAAAGSPEKIREKLTDIFVETIKAAKNLRRFFGLGKEGSALACIITKQSVIKYVFEPGPKKNPKAFAERFRDAIERNPKISELSNGMDINEQEYYKNDVVKARQEKPYFSNPEKFRVEIAKSDLINSVIEKIQVVIQKEITAASIKNTKGNLISVYSVPFKVDMSIIKSEAKNANTLTDFYTNLTTKINDEMVSVLSQMSNTSDYIGFIPTKSYGFNLYFKDRDAAEDVAESLNQDDVKVSEKKKYEKKMAKLYQVLIGDNSAGFTNAPANGTDYFKGTLFARTKVAELIKEKFPDAADQTVVYQYTVKYDEGELKSFLHSLKLDAAEDSINSDVKAKLKAIVENIKKVYSEELISVNSEGTNVIFTFKKDATIDAVKNRIASAMTCDVSRIRVVKSAMTKKEMDDFRQKLDELDDMKSFFNAIGKLNGDTVKLVKADVILKDEVVKQMTSDEYKSQAAELLKNMAEAARTSEGFAGVMVTGKDNAIIEFYFKDKNAYTFGKNAVLQKFDKYIESFPDADESETVELNREDAKKLQDVAESTNLEEYFKKLFDDKTDKEQKIKDQTAGEKTYTLNIVTDIKKFFKLPIADLMNEGALSLLRTTLQESFELSMKNALMRSINLISEAESESINGIYTRLRSWWEEHGKQGTIEDYLKDVGDKHKSEELAIDKLFKFIWERFAVQVKNVITSKAGKEQSDAEFDFKVDNDRLVMHASERVAKFLNGRFLKNSNSFANVINKTIKGSDKLVREFSKAEKLR